MSDFPDLAGDPWVRISSDEYHGGPGVSRSFLFDLYNTTPYHAKWRKEHREEPTDAMILGSAYHTLVLEPHLFDSEYVLAKVSRRSSAGKDAYATMQESGLTPLSPDVWDCIHRMRDALFRHPLAQHLLTGGTPEVSLYSRHPVYNHLEKIRVDYVLPDLTFVDLKSCTCAAHGPFRSHAYSMGYHVQAGMYTALARRLGLKLPESGNFVFIAQESVEPHCIACYYADSEMMRDGIEVYERATEIYVKCEQTGIWPGYPEAFIPLSAPSWARSKRKEQSI